LHCTHTITISPAAAAAATLGFCLIGLFSGFFGDHTSLGQVPQRISNDCWCKILYSSDALPVTTPCYST